jgi:hypothetical protein
LPLQFGFSERQPEKPGKPPKKTDSDTNADDTAPKKKKFFDKAKDLGKQAANTVKTQTEKGMQASQEMLGGLHYGELFAKAGDVYFHAIAVDPATGQRRKYSDLNDSQLRVVALNEKEHNELMTADQADFQKYEQTQSKSKLQTSRPTSVPFPLETLEGFPSDAMTLAKMLDAAKAINDMHAAYEADPTERGPSVHVVNGNAAIITLLGAAAPSDKSGICDEKKCDMVANAYSDNSAFKAFKFIGATYGLAGNADFKTDTIYQDMVAAVTKSNLAAQKAYDDAVKAASAPKPKAAQPKGPHTKTATKTQAPPTAPVAQEPLKLPVLVSPELSIINAFVAQYAYHPDPSPPQPQVRSPQAPTYNK